ncbi:hypothetical protein HY418_00435 [Candidatus Kaiserbacteria bacterium]|nr:hypothetical protein [Candidatus Kaiserbacteria bacterium]
MDSDLSPQPVPAHTNIPTKALFAALVLLGVVAGVAYYSNYLGFRQLLGMQPADSTGLSSVPAQGLLILSLVSVADSAEDFFGVYPYVYDTSRKVLGYVHADRLTGEQKAFTQQYRFSTNGNWAVFIGQGVEPDATTTLRAPEIYRADIAGAADFDMLVTKLQAGEVISSDADVKRAPAISDTGDVLYMTVSPDAPYSPLPEAWSIRHISSSGNSEVLVEGTYPQWVDAQRFIFLKSDGLYLYDIDDRLSSRLWGRSDLITSDSMMDLSEDKTTIVLSTPEYNTVTVLRVSDWDNPNITSDGTIPVAGGWPVVAPDSSAFAILTSDGGFHIAMYDMDSLKPISSSVNLSDADPMLTSLTDWRPL